MPASFQLSIAFKQILLASLLLTVSHALVAQDYQGFGNTHLAINKSAMYTLGGWSVVNLVSGGIGWSQGTGDNKYFHQMNLMWNTVNAGIAIGALIGISNTDYQSMNGSDILADQLKSQKLFLINAGLDILYIGGGAYLRSLSKRSEKNENRLLGYGNSVMLQGGFLLVFDGIMYLIQRNHRLEFVQGISVGMIHDGLKLSYNLNF